MLSIFAPRIGIKELAQLCRRISTGLSAGVDVRRVWSRELTTARGTMRRPLAEISQAVDRGTSVTEAVSATGAFFPTLFLEIVRVGEQTGKLPEMLKQLAEEYDGQVRMRRMFLGTIFWPLLQLVAALFIVGFLIWIVGVIAQIKGGEPIDLLGFGLVGNKGLAIYLLILFVIGLCCVAIYGGIRRGMFWAAPIQSMIMSVPRLGSSIRTLALARLAWTMHITLGTGMNLERALRLSLASTHNVQYTAQAENVVRAVKRGEEIHQALAETGAFPVQFLDAVHVGEQSGRLAETMEVLSKQYQDEARSALQVLTVLAGFVVWGLVAMLIILLIFRLASFYIGVINGAINDIR